MSLYPTPTTSVGQFIVVPGTPPTIDLTPYMVGYTYIFNGNSTVVNFDSTGLVGIPAGWYMILKNATNIPRQVMVCSENGSSMTAPLGPLGSAVYGYIDTPNQNPIPVYLYWDGNHLMLY